MAKKVFLGIGHGGSDPGAVANGIKEKDANLVIGTECATVLRRHGVEVLMSRTADISENLNDKIRRCNAFNPDFAADIHNNAGGGGDGAEVYHHYKGGNGKTLAEKILAEIVKIGQNSRGAKIKKNIWGKDSFAFIRDTNAPAVIVECAFLDNKTDVQTINTVEKQKAMGVALAKGFLTTLGIDFIEETPPESGKTYYVQVGAYKVKANAEAMQKKLKDAGFNAIIKQG